jgi:hypothetical protein
MLFESLYLASRISLVSSYVSAVTAIPSTNILGSLSKYPRKRHAVKYCHLWRTRTAPKIETKVSTLPVKGSSLIAGSFTECVTKTIGTIAVGWVDLCMLKCAVEADRLFSIRLIDFWIAHFVLLIYS